jgi:hypothetical protein
MKNSPILFHQGQEQLQQPAHHTKIKAIKAMRETQVYNDDSDMFAERKSYRNPRTTFKGNNGRAVSMASIPEGVSTQPERRSISLGVIEEQEESETPSYTSFHTLKLNDTMNRKTTTYPAEDG